MTELKTLKDLKNLCFYYRDKGIHDKIKAEAIKWVKHFKATGEYHPDYRDGAINVLKQFHNITEDDLK